MSKLTTIVFALSVAMFGALSGAACKKEEKAAETGKQPAAETKPAEPAKPEPGAAAGSGTAAVAAGSGTAAAAETGSGTAAGAEAGSGAGTAAAAPAPAADALVLAVKVPPVGLKSSSDDVFELAMKLDLGGRKMDMVQSKTERTEAEVLEVAGDAVSKLKVTYAQKGKKQAMGPKVTEEPSPLAGKTFVVGMAGGTLSAVRLDAGQEAPVTPEEQAALAHEHKDLGKVPGIVRLLSSHPWKKGEKVVLTADELALMKQDLADNDDGEVVGGNLTFVGMEGAVATLQMTLDIKAKGSLAMAMTMDMTVDTARVLPLVLTMTGTVSGTTPSPQGPVGVQGTLTGKKAFTYH